MTNNFNINDIDFSSLGLTEKEAKAAFQILKEMDDNGSSKTLDRILKADYNEIPVDIHTFLHDKNYLGGALTSEEGRFTLFPYWEELLEKIYPDPLKPASCNTLALTGAIGIGKSTEAVIICLYELYRMLCLKDPYVYYGVMNIDTITFAVINITLDAAKGVAWNKMQSTIQASPWFMAKGELSKENIPTWKPKGNTKIELIYGSLPRHFIGRALFFSFFDEISFQNNKDVNIQKEKAKELISEASSRMKSRFMKGDVNPTIMVVASSKRTEDSFLETWISDKKKNESKTTLIVDEPQWKIRNDKATDKWFKVAVGNKFLSSELIPSDTPEEDINAFIDRGYRVIDVPNGYYEDFLDDIDNALTTIAGISTTQFSSYISGERLSLCKDDRYVNPFTKDIITVGNGIDDTTQYNEFFDLSSIPKDMISKPMFIHLDMSLSGDKTGIAGIWIKGKRPTMPGEPDDKDLMYQVAFCVSVKAPKGHQVSFKKNRIFIQWLKEQGFNIKKITMDTFQSADMLQSLLDMGFDAETLSVDRVDKSDGSAPVCKPYAYLKSTIYESRLLIPKKGTVLLTEELIGLKRDNNNGHIDHSVESINSKDSADAVCGATFTASKYASEYAYDFGETYELIDAINSERNQVIVDFEDELKKAYQPQTEHFNDFGLGKAQEVSLNNFNDGIIFF